MKLLLSFFTVLLLSACGTDNNNVPEEQISLYKQIEQYKKEYSEVKKTKNNTMIETKEYEIKAFLDQENKEVTHWFGKVVKVFNKVHGISILTVEYKNQEYKLKVVTKEAKDYISTLVAGDEILFSGNLGEEGSLTLSGALDNPEFTFLPTSFKRVEDDSYIIQVPMGEYNDRDNTQTEAW